jgi:hypothetical protein
MFPNGSHLFAKCSGVNSFRAIILITAPKWLLPIGLIRGLGCFLGLLGEGSERVSTG